MNISATDSAADYRSIEDRLEFVILSLATLMVFAGALLYLHGIASQA